MRRLKQRKTVNDDKPVEFVVRNTNSQIDEDDSDDVIPEVFPRRINNT